MRLVIHTPLCLALASLLLSCASSPPAKPDTQAPRQGGPRLSAGEAGEDGGHFELRSAAYTYQADGTYTVTWRERFTVETVSAVEAMSTLSVGWAPWLEERPEIAATVRKPGGEVFELDPATIVEGSAQDPGSDMFSDHRYLSAPLPGVSVGAQVEQVVTVRKRKSLLTGAELEAFNLSAIWDVAEAQVLVTYPDGLDLRWTVEGEGLEVVQAEHEGQRTLQVTAHDQPAYAGWEPFMPQGTAPVARVKITTAARWSELAERYDAIVEGQLAGMDFADIVAQVTTPAMSDEARAAALLAWVQARVRYTGLELGEASIVPRGPEETLARGYGDCKDKAALLVSLLRASGIKANVALLNAGPRDDVSAELPALDVFNHAIVYVPTLAMQWIDPTQPFVGVGGLPDSDRDRFALVASPQTRELIKTPPVHARHNTYLETREVRLADEGLGEVIEHSEATGMIGARLRQQFSEATDASLRKDFETYSEALYGSRQVLDPQIGDPADLDGPFKTTLSVVEAAIAETTNDTATAVISPWVIFEWQPLQLLQGSGGDGHSGDADGAKGRVNPIELPSPYNATLRYHVVPPAGFAALTLPPDFDAVLGEAHLSRTSLVAGDGAVDIEMSLDLGAGALTAEQGAALLEQIEAYGEDAALLIFEHEGARFIDEGRVAEGLAVYRQIVEGGPDVAVHRARLSQALLAAGFGEAARREAEAAVQLAPDGVAGHLALANAASSDAIGRFLSPGWDRPTALSHLQQALSKDPGDLQAHLLLAIALQTNAQGRRFAEGSDIAAAIDHYELALKGENLRQEARPMIEEELVTACFAAGDLRTLREWAGDLQSDSLGAQSRVAAAALEGGGSAGAKEASRLKPSADEARALMAAAAKRLMRLRDYDAARALVAEATPGATGSAYTELRNMSELLSQLKRAEDVVIDSSLPEAPALHIMRSLFIDDTDDLAAQLRDESWTDEDVEEFEQMWGGLKAVISQRIATQFGEATGFGLDLIFSNLEVSKQGLPEVGYRVTAGMRGAVNGAAPALFVRPDGAGWRIVGGADSPAALGRYALQLSEAAELAQARHWLEWAVDELKGGAVGDPYGKPPAQVLWAAGVADEAAGVPVVAAALMAGTADGRVLGLLQGGEGLVTGRAGRALQLAQAQALALADQPAEALEIVRRLQADAEASESLALLEMKLVERVDGADARAALVEVHLAANPTNVQDIAWLAEHRVTLGDLDGAEDLWRRALELEPRQAAFHNQLAWTTLFSGHVDAAAYDHAAEAVKLRPDSSWAALHTMAALRVELGQPAEAYQLLLASLRERPTAEITPDDWYVMGRIAEAYDLAGEARVAYERALIDDDGSALASARLAERRLAALP